MIELEVLYSARARQYTAVATARRHAYHHAELTPRVATRVMELQAGLAAKGQHRSAGPVDLLIAATAVEHDLVVLHYDRDFELLGEVCGVPQLAVVPLGTLD